MSRIGKKPIKIPVGTTVNIDGQVVTAKGPKGELSYKVHPSVKIGKKDNSLELSISRVEDKKEKELWGTNRQIVNNVIIGVSDGYTRQLEINGVGYKAELKGNILALHVGYSHSIEFELPEGVIARVEKNVITLESIDKQLLGETAARIRKVRKPEPYKGKGIKYMEEVIRRKAGKQVKVAER
ncbi:MAG: 50S ribosomal protein L6 [Candidatus Kuenenbacteria bacterium]